VSEKVTANVRENVEEQVILAATGMNKASYYAAVSAGRVDAATQKAVKSAIDNKMASKEITDLISSNIDKQMQSEQVSAMISQKVDEQMQTEEIKNTIKKNAELKMAEKDIQQLIEQNTEAQIQKVISETWQVKKCNQNLLQHRKGQNQLLRSKLPLTTTIHSILDL